MGPHLDTFLQSPLPQSVLLNYSSVLILDAGTDSFRSFLFNRCNFSSIWFLFSSYLFNSFSENFFFDILWFCFIGSSCDVVGFIFGSALAAASSLNTSYTRKFFKKYLKSGCYFSLMCHHYTDFTGSSIVLLLDAGPNSFRSFLFNSCIFGGLWFLFNGFSDNFFFDILWFCFIGSSCDEVEFIFWISLGGGIFFDYLGSYLNGFCFRLYA